MRNVFRPFAAKAAAGAWLLAIGADAHAHSAAKGIGDFYSGALHALTALEHVLPFVALGILAGQQGQKAEPVLGVFCIALLVGAILALWIPGVPYLAVLNISSTIALGGLVAVARPLPAPVFYALAIVFGLSHGFANGEGMAETTKPYLFIPGVALAGLVVTAYGLIVTDWLLRRKTEWLQTALRVAGSWIAAIGILVLAVSGRTLLAS